MKIYFLILLMPIISLSQEEDIECINKYGEIGICKPLLECPTWTGDSSNLPLKTAKDGLPNPKCNYLWDVCCTECYNSDNEVGIYSTLLDCTQVQNRLRKMSDEGISQLKDDDKEYINALRIAKTRTLCCARPNKNVTLHNCNSKINDIKIGTGSGCCGIISDFDSSDYAIKNNPWSVLLEYDSKGKPQVQCKGTLISNRYVLTVAHCVDNHPPKYVLFGNTGKFCKDLPYGNDDFPTDAFCVPVEAAVFHSNYRGTFFHNDIGLVRLKLKIIYTGTVRPICFPPMSSVSKELILVSGENTNKSLVRLTPVDRQVCEKKMRELTPGNLTIQDKQLCAVGEPGQDSCRGDSGGPLMTNIGGRFELTGLVSYGQLKCGQGNPSVNTLIFPHIDWIREQMATLNNHRVEITSAEELPANTFDIKNTIKYIVNTKTDAPTKLTQNGSPNDEVISSLSELLKVMKESKLLSKLSSSYVVEIEYGFKLKTRNSSKLFVP